MQTDTPALEEFDPGDDARSDLGIVLASVPDDEAFWRLVADDAEERSAAYGRPAGPVDLTLAEEDSPPGWTRYGAAILAWAHANIQQPEWTWWTWVGDDVAPEPAEEGTPDAFLGALIRHRCSPCHSVRTCINPTPCLDRTRIEV